MLISAERIIGNGAVPLKVDCRCPYTGDGNIARQPHVVVCYYTTAPRTWTSHPSRRTELLQGRLTGPVHKLKAPKRSGTVRNTPTWRFLPAQEWSSVILVKRE